MSESKGESKDELKCTFCGKKQNEVFIIMVASMDNEAAICNDCAINVFHVLLDYMKKRLG